MSVADVSGVKLSGLLFDAGTVNSPVLLQVGTPNAHKSDPNDPSLLSDVFLRIGSANSGQLAPRDTQLRGFNVIALEERQSFAPSNRCQPTGAFTPFKNATTT